MNGHTVIYVEDNDAARLSLAATLELYGFRVEGARNVAEARALARDKEIGGKASVIVLDMQLDDPAAPGVTGAHIGIEIRDQQRDTPPEFIIHTAHQKPHYYELAMQLGAAAYVVKAAPPQGRLMRVVRALAVRFALNRTRRDVRALATIVQLAGSRIEAAESFCRQVLSRELAAVLGAPFLLLLTNGGRTRVICDDPDVSSGPPNAYELLQACTYGDLASTGPLIFDAQRLAGHVPVDEQAFFQRLNGSAFVPLTAGSDMKLSLGILRAMSPQEVASVEDIQDLAGVVLHYLRQTITETLLAATSLREEIMARQEAMLTATSRLCVYVTNGLRTILDDAVNAGELNPGGEHASRLIELGDDVHSTGELLGSLEKESKEGRQTLTQDVSLAEVIKSAWREVADLLELDLDMLAVYGDCRVDTHRVAIERAISCILRWFGQRCDMMPPGKRPGISVRFAETVEGAQAVFEDRSRRLPDSLRRRLFDPFPGPMPPPHRRTGGHNETRETIHLPLYAARVLISVRGGGTVEDRTEDLERSTGHRLVIHFLVPTRDGAPRVP